MDKIELYLLQHGRDPKLSGGYCFGLALLWGYKKSIGEEKEFLDLINKIEHWDGIKDLETEFEKLFSWIEWLQGEGKRVPITQAHPEKLIETIESASPIQVEFSTAYLFKETEIIKLLHEILKNEGKKVLIGSHNHSLSIVFEEEKYKFFDSNGGVREFTNIEDLVLNPQKGLLQAFVFENNRINKILTSLAIKKPWPEYIPLIIRVFDLKGTKPGNYPENPILKIVEERKLLNQNSGVDNNQAWDGVTAACLAAKDNDVETLKTLINLKANIN